jgi:hypothetical protein
MVVAENADTPSAIIIIANTKFVTVCILLYLFGFNVITGYLKLKSLIVRLLQCVTFHEGA